jgi:hypothetical protein
MPRAGGTAIRDSMVAWWDNRAADASAPARRSEPDIATMNLISVDSNDTPVRYRKHGWWTSSIVRTYHLDYMFYDEHFTLSLYNLAD